MIRAHLNPVIHGMAQSHGFLWEISLNKHHKQEL